MNIPSLNTRNLQQTNQPGPSSNDTASRPPSMPSIEEARAKNLADSSAKATAGRFEALDLQTNDKPKKNKKFQQELKSYHSSLQKLPVHMLTEEKASFDKYLLKDYKKQESTLQAPLRALKKTDDFLVSRAAGAPSITPGGMALASITPTPLPEVVEAAHYSRQPSPISGQAAAAYALEQSELAKLATAPRPKINGMGVRKADEQKRIIDIKEVINSTISTIQQAQKEKSAYIQTADEITTFDMEGDKVGELASRKREDERNTQEMQKMEAAHKKLNDMATSLEW